MLGHYEASDIVGL